LEKTGETIDWWGGGGEEEPILCRQKTKSPNLLRGKEGKVRQEKKKGVSTLVSNGGGGKKKRRTVRRPLKTGLEKELKPEWEKLGINGLSANWEKEKEEENDGCASQRKKKKCNKIRIAKKEGRKVCCEIPRIKQKKKKSVPFVIAKWKERASSRIGEKRR